MGHRACFFSSANDLRAWANLDLDPPPVGGIDSEICQIPLCIPPDLRAYGLCPGLGDWIIPTPGEIVPPVKPQTDLESTVIVTHLGWLLQHTHAWI